ncbi:MAG: addiction module protein [Planctomycetes bacterium]|nr:addiction module protein [Planctomycetota bacterium]
MSEAAEKLKPMLAALNADERAEVIEYLTSLEDDDGEWDPEFIDEINRRVADYEAGKTVGIPHEEVMRQMKEKYG